MKSIERQKRALGNLLGVETLPSSLDAFPEQITLPRIMLNRAMHLAAETTKDHRIRTARLEYNGQDWESKAERRGSRYRVHTNNIHTNSEPLLAQLSRVFHKPMIYLHTDAPHSWPDTQEYIESIPPEGKARFMPKSLPYYRVSYPRGCSHVPSPADVFYSMYGWCGRLGALRSSQEGLCLLLGREHCQDSFLERQERAELAMTSLASTAEQAAELDEAIAREVMLQGVTRAVKEVFACYFTDDPIEGVLHRVPT